MRCRPLLPGTQLATTVHVDWRWQTGVLPPGAHGGAGNDRGPLSGGLRMCQRHDHRDVRERQVLPGGIAGAATLRSRVEVRRICHEADKVRGGNALPTGQHRGDIVRRGKVLNEPSQAMRELRAGQVPAKRRQGGLHQVR